MGDDTYERLIAELEFLGPEMEDDTMPDYAACPREAYRRLLQHSKDALERNQRRRDLLGWRCDYQLLAIFRRR
jgi:hypothetical protein